MLTDKTTIAQVFSNCHDGTIHLERKEGLNQYWKIDCLYLAKMIHPTYEFFWLKLDNVKRLEFHPLNKDLTTPTKIWTTFEAIAQLELEILTATVENNNIKIIGQQDNPILDSEGGELWLDSQGITFWDEKKQPLSAESFRVITNRYWNENF